MLDNLKLETFARVESECETSNSKLKPETRNSKL